MRRQGPMSDQDISDVARDFLILDALAQGVPEDRDTIVDWVRSVGSGTTEDFQRIQGLAEIALFGEEEIDQRLLALCRKGFIRALPTNSEGSILPRVENEPRKEMLERYYFEISHSGKLQWKTWEDVLDKALGK